MLLGVVVLLYALTSSVLDRASITGPMVLVAVGAVLGPGGADLLHLSVRADSLKVLAEVSLALILFGDASSLTTTGARSQAGVTGRLLGIGLPLTIALGTVACHLLFPGIGWAACALVGSLLAPTDAALGLAVVTNPAVPEGVRETLSIESGLNDGLATPFVYFFLALTLAERTHGHWVHAGVDLAVGVGVGAGVGLAAGWLSAWACRTWTVESRARQLAVLTSGLLCYAAALAAGGNGFVAAYVAGFAFTLGSRGALAHARELADDAGTLSSLAVWLLFGVAAVGPVLAGGISWAAVGYAALSLTIVRMVPVALALVGTGTRAVTVAFLGWFGPRGLASVVFLIVATDTIPASPVVQTLGQVGTWTILASVVLHGLSSRPLATAFGRAVGAGGDVPQGRFTVARRRPAVGPGAAGTAQTVPGGSQ